MKTAKTIVAIPQRTVVFLRTLMRRHRSVPIIMTGISIVGFFSGFFLPNQIKIEQLSSILERYSEINNSSAPQFIALFLNNITVALLSLLLGFLIITPVMTAYLTGFIMGIFLDITLRLSTISGKNLLPTAIVGILPHGILEIPAALLSTMLGVYWGLKLYSNRLFLPEIKRLEFIKNIFLAFMVFCVPMLFTAAIIEATITPLLIDKTNQSLSLSVTLPKVNEACFVSNEELRGLQQQVKAVTNNETDAYTTTSSIATLLYDDLTYTTLKQLKPLAQSSKVYELQNNTTIVIALTKMVSGEDAQKEADLSYHIVRVAQKQQSEVLVQRQKDRLILTKGSKISLETFGHVNTYAYMIQLNKKHDSLFSDVLNLQQEKLRNCQKLQLSNENY